MTTLITKFNSDVKKRYVEKLADYDPDKNYGPLKADTLQVPETTWFEELANSAPVSGAIDAYDAAMTNISDNMYALGDIGKNIGSNILEGLDNGIRNIIDNSDSLRDMAGIAMHEILPDPALSAADANIASEYAYQHSPELKKRRYNNIMQNYPKMQGATGHEMDISAPWLYNKFLDSTDPREKRITWLSKVLSAVKDGNISTEEGKKYLSDMDLYDYFTGDKAKSVEARDNMMALTGKY